MLYLAARFITPGRIGLEDGPGLLLYRVFQTQRVLVTPTETVEQCYDSGR